ncbi:MAG TPA: folate-binding protein [Microlunatus sp.]
MSAAVIAEDGPDRGVAWHYGNPMREQREIEAGRGLVDLSHRGVLTVTGPDRLSWLHSLTTQQLTDLPPGIGTTALVLSGAQGHIQHVLYAVDDGETFWAHTEPGAVQDLVGWLDSMRFMLRVEVADRTADFGIVWRAGQGPDGLDGASDKLITRSAPDSLGGQDLFVPRSELADVIAAAEHPAGTWALEARRIAAGIARIGIDTDHRAIPNEAGLLETAVHLNKGCYPGQETVGRVQALGRPPRRLVRLQLDGSAEALPAVAAPVKLGEREVGRMGSSARHYEEGPIGLALIKRNVPVDADLLVDGIAAAQEVLVDPEIGDHFRPQLR